MPKGYTGKILHVNLSSGASWIEQPDDLFYRRYLGGSGLVGYYLLKEVPQGADPLALTISSFLRPAPLQVCL